MKKLILLLGILLTPVLNAHFFAYQEWEKDGQAIHEFFDMHDTLNATINPAEQRALLVSIAQKCKNVLVIAEDTASFAMNANFTNTDNRNKQAILKESNEFECSTPLTALCAHCFDKDIDVYNFECRPCQSTETMFTADIDQQHIAEIAAHQDGDILSTFYMSLKQDALEISRLNNDNAHINRHYNCFVLDARVLHALYTSTHKNIVLAAGAGHIIRVNNILHSLGWRLKRYILPDVLTPQQHAHLARILTLPQTDSQAELMNTFYEGLSNTLELVQSNAIDLSTLQHVITHNPNNVLKECFNLAAA